MLASRRVIARTSSRTLGASASVAATSAHGGTRGIYIPRVTERRAGEQGPGGRSSNADLTVAVFGAGGFLGRYVCSKNGSNGVKTYVGNRGDEFEMRHLNPMFDLGRLRKVFYSSKDRDSMAEVIADADVVVNLVGQYYDTKAPADKPSFPYLEMQINSSLEDSNVTVPQTIAELCTEMQVDNLIHVSALAASEDSSCEWLRMKARGEQAVKEAYPWATIVRPAATFGHEDRLLNWFAITATIAPFVPLVDGGEALTQPVYVADVAEVITRVMDDPANFEGRTIEVFGPQDYTYKELAQFVFDITGQEPRVWDVPKDVLKSVAKLTQYQPKPMLTPDKVELWSTDVAASMSTDEYAAQKDATDGILTLTDFGIAATPIEKIAFEYLHRFRTGGHFVMAEGYHKEVEPSKY